VVWAYGKFIQAVFDFALIAFVIFIAVRGINRLKREEKAAPAAPPAPPRQEVLLEEIRDLLRK
jgi:large conductance mechanosensitive channel